MAAPIEDTQRELGRLRGDLSDTVAELRRRVRGGLPALTGSDARVSGARTGQDVAARLTAGPALPSLAALVSVAVVGVAIYRMTVGRRKSHDVRERLKGVGEARQRLVRARERTHLLVKVKPDQDGYLRVLDARLDLGGRNKRSNWNVLKKLIWAALLSVTMALSSVLARRLASQVWRSTVHEDPPTEKKKAEA